MTTMHSYSAHARAGTENWEEYVGYVYDDKRPPIVINGKRQYVEWDGGEVRGTLTGGFGHTDAAGAPKLVQGMRFTRAQADEMLSRDLAPVVRQVNRDVTVPLTQGQFDALVDFCFNCGEGSLKHLIVKLNQGNYDDIPGHMMQFVMSKGERMQGLVNRRHFDVALWGSNEPTEVANAGANVNDPAIFSPKAERSPPPKTMITSKSGAAAATTAAGGALATVQAMNDAAIPLAEAKQNAQDLGVFEVLGHLMHSPQAGLFFVGLVIIGLGAFLYWDRRRKLIQEHV